MSINNRKKNAVKREIEEIAKNILEKERKYKISNTPKSERIIKKERKKFPDKSINENNVKGTIKDNFTRLGITKSSTAKFNSRNNITNKKDKTYLNFVYNKTNNNIDYTNNLYTNCPQNIKFSNGSITLSENNYNFYYCCKKAKSNNSNEILSQNPNPNYIQNNKINTEPSEVINKNFYNTFNEKNIIEPLDSSITIVESNESTKIKISEEYLNNIDKIYTNIIVELEKLNLQYIDNDFNKIIKIRKNACEYIKFLISNEMALILNEFKYNINICKFILYQMYLFLLIIYLDFKKQLDQYKILSYKTMLTYSHHNYKILHKLISNISLIFDGKIEKRLINKNKILYVVLKVLNPELPSTSDVNNYINGGKSAKNLSITNSSNRLISDTEVFLSSINSLEEIGSEIKKKDYTKVIKKDENLKFIGMIHLVNLLKENNNLNKKIKEYDKLQIRENLQENDKNTNTNKKKSISCKKFELFEIKYLLLPKFDSKKYKYSIFIDLDETLVFYFEENNSYYVKVRYGTDKFFEALNSFCEINIISMSGKEYSDVIINDFQKEKYEVNNRIYKENLGNSKLDLTLINRDLNKCIFIGHEKNFYNAPKDKIINMDEFKGDEEDKQLETVTKGLKKLKTSNIIGNTHLDLVDLITTINKSLNC